MWVRLAYRLHDTFSRTHPIIMQFSTQLYSINITLQIEGEPNPSKLSRISASTFLIFYRILCKDSSMKICVKQTFCYNYYDHKYNISFNREFLGHTDGAKSRKKIHYIRTFQSKTLFKHQHKFIHFETMFEQNALIFHTIRVPFSYLVDLIMSSKMMLYCTD